MRLACALCDQPVEGDGPAVLSLDDTHWWEPFIDDIRSSSPFVFHHPRCYADSFGVDDLIDAVRREDDRRAGRLSS